MHMDTVAAPLTLLMARNLLFLNQGLFRNLPITYRIQILLETLRRQTRLQNQLYKWPVRAHMCMMDTITATLKVTEFSMILP